MYENYLCRSDRWRTFNPLASIVFRNRRWIVLHNGFWFLSRSIAVRKVLRHSFLSLFSSKLPFGNCFLGFLRAWSVLKFIFTMVNMFYYRKLTNLFTSFIFIIRFLEFLNWGISFLKSCCETANSAVSARHKSILFSFMGAIFFRNSLLGVLRS
jgi:hypothetical protein